MKKKAIYQLTGIFSGSLVKGLPETLRHIAKHLHPFAVVWLLTLNNYSTGNFVQK
ncbi:hypothetical protein EIKCOROL_02187 [Eikenella corrodens ATCC 23834]|uniref:Uncharacterized protein n=1 Tax=Eikenella corrodens ATCC 23834 TaxID=546274 RepID=C0DXS5_EIKCO|nr:hypothetical protein EIKCOROL_02187 [Eikenella corrodens ATCC 23834]